MSYEAVLKAHYAALRKKFWTPQEKRKKEIAPTLPVFIPPPPPRVLFVPKPEPMKTSVRKIITLVSGQSLIGVADIKSNRRIVTFVRERHKAIYLIRLFTKRSMPSIGQEFNLDHTSVLHAIRKVAIRRLFDCAYDSELNEIEQLLGGDDEMVRRKESMVGPIGWGRSKRPGDSQRNGTGLVSECGTRNTAPTGEGISQAAVASPDHESLSAEVLAANTITKYDDEDARDIDACGIDK